MLNYKKSFFKYLKPSLLLTLALCSIPSVAKADDFRLQFGIGSNGFAVGVPTEGWREHEWREHEWREHEWRERQWREHQWHEKRERERARYFEQRYNDGY